MTSKSEKLLRKLESKQRQVILVALKKLAVGREEGMDIKPLKGQKYLFRVRVGAYRILFRRQDGKFEFIALSKRDDQTYRNY